MDRNTINVSEAEKEMILMLLSVGKNCNNSQLGDKMQMFYINWCQLSKATKHALGNYVRNRIQKNFLPGYKSMIEAFHEWDEAQNTSGAPGWNCKEFIDYLLTGTVEGEVRALVSQTETLWKEFRMLELKKKQNSFQSDVSNGSVEQNDIEPRVKDISSSGTQVQNTTEEKNSSHRLQGKGKSSRGQSKTDDDCIRSKSAPNKSSSMNNDCKEIQNQNPLLTMTTTTSEPNGKLRKKLHTRSEPIYKSSQIADQGFNKQGSSKENPIHSSQPELHQTIKDSPNSTMGIDGSSSDEECGLLQRCDTETNQSRQEQTANWVANCSAVNIEKHGDGEK